MRYLLLALFLIPFVSADYLAAVSESAPASDVVFAANFASYMKQAAGVDFSGVIDRDVYSDESPETLADDSIVLIDGQEKYALYVIGSSTSSKHKSVAETATDYLEDKGFDVDQTSSNSIEQQDLLIGQEREEKEEAVAKQEPTEEKKDEEAPVKVVPIIAEEAKPEPVVEEPVKETESVPLQDIKVEEKKPNVISRIASWFRALF